jgi:N utilization substance protein B
MPETPASVIIDEAIEIGKVYGTSETGPFLNGILDTIAKSRA